MGGRARGRPPAAMSALDAAEGPGLPRHAGVEHLLAQPQVFRVVDTVRAERVLLEAALDHRGVLGDARAVVEAGHAGVEPRRAGLHGAGVVGCGGAGLVDVEAGAHARIGAHRLAGVVARLGRDAVIEQHLAGVDLGDRGRLGDAGGVDLEARGVGRVGGVARIGIARVARVARPIGIARVTRVARVVGIARVAGVSRIPGIPRIVLLRARAVVIARVVVLTPPVAAARQVGLLLRRAGLDRLGPSASSMQAS